LLVCFGLAACVAGCGGGGSVPHAVATVGPSLATAAPAPTSQTTAYAVDESTDAAALVADDVLADGAIIYSSTEIEPYFANGAAIGLAKTKSHLSAVQGWMAWYLRHLNSPDQWGLTGTIYDYAVSASGTETSTGNCDSTDSYAATFLTLARAYYDTGNASAQAYVKSIQTQLTAIGGVIVATQQSDGLTIAKPDYAVRYLMDNSEVYRGVSDLAYLFGTAFDDPTGAAYWQGVANRVAAGIAADLWNAGAGDYAPAEFADGSAPAANLSNWYPDATAQLYPVVNGVVAPTSPQATSVYAKFNAAFPGWDDFGFPDQFPWAIVFDAAARMGDTARAGVYEQKVQSTYGTSGYSWPWYDAEAGWYMRSNVILAGNTTYP